MIVVKLYGGLGNQMYQYATGKALSLRHEVKLYLHTSWFEEIKGYSDATQRIYELDGFGIRPKKMSMVDKILFKYHPPVLFKEAGLEYQSGFEELGGNAILDGYWQSYKYFEAYENQIKYDFKFPDISTAENKKAMDAIIKSESISVHVRRGDYNTKRGRSYHGLVKPEYYYNSIRKMKVHVKNPKIFVFSDEINWCRKNLEFDFPTEFIYSKGPNSGVEDMHLMSSCKHNIIANSSFSWWAAWLNQNNNKVVCAPANWFAGAEHCIEDRIPPKWIII